MKGSEFPIATLYCDESGNTGSNLLSTIDPFFVYAWVLLTVEQEKAFEKQILGILTHEGLPPSTELRSVELWQSSRGCHRMDEALRTAHNAGATIFITFSQKIFELCIFIIETYMDEIKNPKVNERFRDIRYKRLLANAILNSVPRDFFKQFLDACNADDIQALKALGVRLAKMLALHPDDRISAAAPVIESGIDNIYRFGERLDKTPASLHSTTSHVTVFSLPLLYIDDKLSQFQLKAKLVRHQDLQFGRTLDLTFRTMIKMGLGIKNVISSEEGLSTRLRGLQIADLAAGITARVLRARYSRRSLKQYQWSIWKSLVGSLPFGSWSYQLTSDACEAEIVPLLKVLPDESWYKEPQFVDANNPPSCSCGLIITSGHLRDFYLHVLDCHPDAQVMGFPCSFCKELVPFGLGACHAVLEHGINPPLLGASYGELKRDHEVLEKVRIAKIKIVFPRDESANS